MPYCVSYLVEADGYVAAWDGDPLHLPRVFTFEDFKESVLKSNVHAPLFDIWNNEGDEESCMMFETLPDILQGLELEVLRAERVQENGTVYWNLHLVNVSGESLVLDTTPMDIDFWEQTHQDVFDVTVGVVHDFGFRTPATSPEEALALAKTHAKNQLWVTSPPSTWNIRLVKENPA